MHEGVEGIYGRAEGVQEGGGMVRGGAEWLGGSVRIFVF